MPAIKLMIADQSQVFTEHVVSYLNKYPDIEVIGCCKSGAELIEQTQLHSPDAVLMDIILEGMDGFSALKLLNPAAHRTAFIICTEFFNEITVRRAHKCGASCFLCKPVSAESLLNSICESVYDDESEASSIYETHIDENDLSAQITGKLLSMGLPSNLKGFRMIRQSVISAAHDPALMDSMTKRLYPEMAKLFNVAASSIERDIRTTITRAYEGGLDATFGHRPTNRELISVVLHAINYNKGA